MKIRAGIDWQSILNSGDPLETQIARGGTSVAAGCSSNV